MSSITNRILVSDIWVRYTSVDMLLKGDTKTCRYSVGFQPKSYIPEIQLSSKWLNLTTDYNTFNVEMNISITKTKYSNILLKKMT